MQHPPAPSATLPGPFAAAPGSVMAPPPAVAALAAGQVKALLDAAPAFYQLPAPARARMQADLEKIAGYSAALIHDDWSQSERMGQSPVVRGRRVIEGRVGERPATARPLETGLSGFQRGEEGTFTPVAASNVAKITEDTLNAIAFPTFVADLIKGTFQAIVDASIQQMEAYGALLANVAKTVDQFMSDNITDNNARDWLAGAFPRQVRLDTSSGTPVLRKAEGADDAPSPDYQTELNVGADFSLDDDSIEEVLVPAARRKIAQGRQQTLATMVLMGMNRIVVTRGRIKAAMGFRIDTTDRASTEFASNFEKKHESAVSHSWFLSPVKASVKNSVAYVSSTKKNSESEIDVSADLTGEVDLQFKADYFPLERFADTGVIAQIQQNTPNPNANKPVTGATATPAAT